MTALAGAVLVLVPLLIAPGLLFYFDVTPKIAALLAGAAMALPWFGPLRLWRGVAGRRLAILLLLQAASVTLSTMVSVRPELSIAGTNWRRFGLIVQLCLLLFTAVTAIAAAGRVRWFLRIIALGGVPIALYGIAQYFGWDPWLPAGAYHIGEGVWTIVRPPSTLGYVSYFATYELSVLFAGAGLWMSEKQRAWRMAGALAVALAAAAIVLSGTRAAMLGIGVGLAVLAIWLRVRISARVVAAGLAAAALAAGFYFSPPGQALRSRMRWFREDPLGGARLALWRDAARLGMRRPLLGTGPETFTAEFPKVQSVELSRAYPDFFHESAHNIFLDAFTAQGVPGLAVLLALTVFGFHAAWQARLENPRLAAALAATLAAIVTSQQFTVFTLPTALYFYCTIALITGLDSTWDRPPGRSGLGIRLMSALLLAIITVRFVAADRALLETERALSAGRISEAAAAYARAERFGLRAPLWYSRAAAAAAQRSPDLLARVQAWQQALAAGVSATSTAEDPQNAWYSLASLYAARDDCARTEHSLRAAITASPNWFKPHWMLAQTLLAAGRRDEARAEAERAAVLDGGKHPEVAALRSKL